MKVEPDVSVGATSRPTAGTIPLSAMGRGASLTSSVEEQLELFLHAIVRLANAKAGAVRLLSDDGQTMRLVGAVGLPPAVMERERLVRADCGTCGIALQSPHGTATRAALDCQRSNSQRFFGADCGHVVALRLEHKGQIFGVYNLFLADDSALPDGIPALLRVLGDMFGGTLHDAREHVEAMTATVVHERRKMAGELHDSVLQSLHFVKMRMALVEHALAANAVQDARNFLVDIGTAVDDAYGNLRELLTHFRSRMDPRGLIPALQVLVDSFQATSGVQAALDNRMTSLTLDEERALQVFLVVQEAMTNAARHAAAKSVHVLLERDAEQVRVRIEDDGCGFAPADLRAPHHHGVNIMCERAARIGGTLDISAATTGGTCVVLRFPIEANAI